MRKVPHLNDGSGQYPARTFVNAAGERVEESDRCLEALRYKQLIEDCFAAAKQ